MKRCRFLLLEADIDSDEDVDGDYAEEEEARRIEGEEEFYNSFINDSSQLDYTQDDLDRIGLSENAQTPFMQQSMRHGLTPMSRQKSNSL
jgi:hypothetical protein